jgi:WD40 repeat protein
MGRQIHQLEGHSEAANSCTFLKGADMLACTVSADQTVRLWDVRTEKAVLQKIFASSLPMGPLTCVVALPVTSLPGRPAKVRSISRRIQYAVWRLLSSTIL